MIIYPHLVFFLGVGGGGVLKQILAWGYRGLRVYHDFGGLQGLVTVGLVFGVLLPSVAWEEACK